MADRVDRERMLRDHEYLISVVCQKFQSVDKYHRGLITAASFAQALQELGLRYGQKEVVDILQYCTITDDGYVHYKELLHIVSPSTPRAKKSVAKVTIFPDEEEARAREHARLRDTQSFLAERAESIRKLYSRWERSQLSNDQFKEGLRSLGARPTEELERLLTVTGPARHMPFGKLMYALQVEENDGRRGRATHGGRSGTETPSSIADSVTMQNEPLGQGDALSDVSSHMNGGSANPRDPGLRQAIVDFVDGAIPAVTFRMHLRRHGAVVSSRLDRLIRTHECDNSVRFQDFARELLQKDSDNRSAGGRGSDASSDLGGRSRRPYAVDDTCSLGSCNGASASSSDAGYPRRAKSSSGSIARAHAQGYPAGPGVAPPWATAATVEAPPARPRPKSTSRAQGNHGDITSWHSQRDAPLAPPKERVLREVHDCFNWPSGGRPDEGEQEPVRFRKRFYGQAPPAGAVAPFGRTCDIDPPMQSRHAISVPFGTDRDHRHRRPEEAGTDEYRASNIRSGLR